jgi:hypothetical protein
VRQNRFIAGVNAGPVRTAMAHQAGKFQCLFTQLACVSFNIQYAKNRTHNLLRYPVVFDVVLFVLRSLACLRKCRKGGGRKGFTAEKEKTQW